MTADVYSGDVDTEASVQSATKVHTCRFSVTADAEPDVLVRTAMMLALGNVAPASLQLVTIDGGQVQMEVIVPGLHAQTADYIVRKLLQLTSVTVADVVLDPELTTSSG